MSCFLSLEGVEGTGKSTQMAFIVDYLKSKGKSVCATREPGGTELGERIRQLLLSNELPAMHARTELLLMYAARNEHIKKVIEPELEAGNWVVSDRYVDASYAYQGYGRDMSLAELDQLSDLVVKQCWPDLTILLDIDLQVSQQRVQDRGDKDRFEHEDQTFYTKVRNGYLKLTKKHPDRIKIVDASQSISQVQSLISSILDDFIVKNDA